MRPTISLFLVCFTVAALISGCKEKTGRGGRICLIDRWFNPTDTLAQRYCMYSLTFDGEGRLGDTPILRPGKWQEISFRWEDSRSTTCELLIDGRPYPHPLELNRPGGFPGRIGEGRNPALALRVITGYIYMAEWM